MQLIYIAGKYTAPTKQEIKRNIQEAEDLAKEVLLLGLTPIVPHKMTSFFDLKYQELSTWKREDWLHRFCFPLLLRCDAVLMVPNWLESLGARAENAFACLNSIPVFYSIDEIKDAINKET